MLYNKGERGRLGQHATWFVSGDHAVNRRVARLCHAPGSPLQQAVHWMVRASRRAPSRRWCGRLPACTARPAHATAPHARRRPPQRGPSVATQAFFPHSLVGPLPLDSPRSVKWARRMRATPDTLSSRAPAGLLGQSLARMARGVFEWREWGTPAPTRAAAVGRFPGPTGPTPSGAQPELWPT